MKTVPNKTKFIRRRILIPVVFVFVLLLALTVVSLSWLQRKNINSSIEKQANATQKLFSSYMTHDAFLMDSLLQLYGDNPEIVKAFHERNRVKLLNVFKHFLSNLRKDVQITHFAFLEADGKVFFRAHQPEKYGDYLYHFDIKPEDVKPGKIS